MPISMTAQQRLQRLLALVPWVAAHADGADINEICRRFDLDRQQLLADLDVVMMVGVYPFSPDALIDVWIEDDIVSIRFADYFARPLQLTASEGLSLLVAGRALLGSPGSDPDGPLSRALAKLSDAIGPVTDQVVDVQLGATSSAVFRALERGRQRQLQVDIDYYSSMRDSRGVRTIEPATVFTTGGHWYVAAWCHRAQGERLFRLDRIAEAMPTETPFERPPLSDEPTIEFNDEKLPRVVLDVSPSSVWLFDGVPLRASTTLADGHVEVTVNVASRLWLERTLVQLGPEVVIRSIDPRLGERDLAAGVAARMLARYEEVDLT